MLLSVPLSAQATGAGQCHELFQLTPMALRAENSPTFDRNYREVYLQISEITGIPVRTQCFGTCFLYSNQGSLEVALRSEGHLQAQDYVVNFIPLMNMAWNRYYRQEGMTSFRDLVSGGTSKNALEMMMKYHTFYIPADQVRSLGGHHTIEYVENQLITQLVEVGWSKGSRTYSVETLLNLDHREFQEVLMDIFQQGFRAHAGQDLVLREVKTFGFKVIQYKRIPFKGTYRFSPMFVFQGDAAALRDSRINNFILDSTNTPADALGYHVLSKNMRRVDDFKKDFITALVDHLDNGRSADAIIEGFFERSDGRDSAHMVTLVGVQRDVHTNAVTGIKYVNSWGLDFGSKGFDIFTIEQLEKHLTTATIITQVQVSK